MSRAPPTLEERRALRRKPFWRVADFARYMCLSHWQAKSILVRYDAELHGMLLRRSNGTNRLYGFFWAALAKHAPEAFIDDPLETQRRVDILEDLVDDVREGHRHIVAQTVQNTRDIATLKRTRNRAA